MKQKKESAPPAQPTFKFDLAEASPSISEHGNTIREANQNDFPVLAGNGVAFFMIDMKPGALRVPHWHPNAWELDYCVQGEAQFWLVGPDNAGNMVKQVVRIKPGQLFFIPQGWFHAIKNVDSGDLKLLLTFNNGMPTDIGIPVGLNGIGSDVFAQTFEVSPELFNDFNESNKFFAPAVPQKQNPLRKR
ncbi:MAG TPA: cupin domain-containing protein [Candidatus Angelobacter sp.]|jgi:oxalate decarboxylase|nr:cupin domain-containing protein [Candidatus Angelobacter sp.]